MASLIEKDTSGIYIAQEGERELPQKRTRAFKTFKRSGTRQRRIAGQIGPIHYRQDPFDLAEEWKDIDLTINLTPSEDWDAAMESNGYQVRFWQNRVIAGKTVRYIAQFRRAGKWLAMCPLALVWENDAGQRELISKPVPGINPVIDNDSYTVTWADCFGSGIHYRYNVSPDRFFKTVIVDNKTDLPAPTIPGPGLKLTVVLGVAWHSQSKAANGFADSVVPDEMPNDSSDAGVDEELVDSDMFAYKDESLRDTFWMRRPKAWDSAEESHSIDIAWRLRRRGNQIFVALSVPASALNAPQVEYPIYIDVDMSEEQVGAIYDDGYTVNGSYTNGADRRTRVNLWHNDTTADIESLMRFTSVPIPNGVTIDTTELSLWSSGIAFQDDLSATFYGEDHDSSVDLQDPNTVINDRDKTTASVAWVEEILGLAYRTSPEMKTIIQEVISRPGWVTGNDLSIISAAISSGDSCWTQAYLTGESRTAKLNVSYTEVRARIMGGGNFNAKGKSPSGKIVNVSRYTANQTLVRANHHVAGDTDGGAFTVTLPAGIKGTEYRIGNTGTSGNDLTITPDGSELLIGVNTSFVLSDSEVLHIVYEPTEGWF